VFSGGIIKYKHIKVLNTHNGAAVSRQKTNEINMTNDYNKMNRPTIGILTSGTHSTKDKMTRFKGINLASGEELFSRSVGNKTKTIGKFIAIVEAAKYILRYPETPRIIYSDSPVADRWYYNKRAKSSQYFPELEIALIVIKVMDALMKDIEVVCWDRQKWGEIPVCFDEKGDM